MLKVGITGGIGSGKSTVCLVFETLGIPVFYADDEARRLMHSDPALRAQIENIFGSGAYLDGVLQRSFLSEKAFGNPDLLQRLNAVVHPATIAHGKAWMAAQTTPYAIKEAALFFESGSAAEMDVMIGVSAPEEVRIARVMARENVVLEAVLRRIARQMPDAEKMAACNFVILNDDQTAVLPQVLALDKRFRTGKK